MAVYKSGILGAFSGKVGSVVGASWRGIDYMRSLAASVGNPRTPAQQSNRQLMSVIAQGLSPFKYLIRDGFIPRKGESSWSDAVRRNRERLESLGPIGGSWTFDPAQAVYTNGSYFFAISVTSSRDNNYTLTWSPPDVGYPLADGNIYVGIYNPLTRICETHRAPVSASSLDISVGGMVTEVGQQLLLIAFGRDDTTVSVAVVQTLTSGS